MVIKHYRWHTGTWAWILHRLSGLALVSYLCLHIWVTHHVSQGRQAYESLMRTMSLPAFKVFEWCLLGVVVYHALNGVRIIAIDLGWIDTKRGHKILFWVLMSLGLAGWLASLPAFLHELY